MKKKIEASKESKFELKDQKSMSYADMQSLIKWIKKKPDVMNNRATRRSVCRVATRELGFPVTIYWLDIARRQLNLVAKKK